jgi:hypothetical protein
VILGWALLSAPPAAAQGTAASGIAGVVRDSSGAVLPGVSVEAASPALIEKVRSVVTDDQGQYKIIDLRAGTYAVTFTLPGFSTVRRENVELGTSFTATINAEMAVGALQETVTVSGSSPIVDTHEVRQQSVLQQEVIAAAPLTRALNALAQITPGLSISEGGQSFQDVGGSVGEGQRLIYHGARYNDGGFLMNGMPANSSTTTQSSSVRADVSEVQEFNLQTGGYSAEYREGGVQVNLIPKEGGNTYSGNFTGIFANHSMQGNNLDADLKARNLPAANRLDHIWDTGVNVGGPLKRDKLWFFGNLRYWGSDSLIAGQFHDSNVSDNIFTPDLNRQAHDVTWQFQQSVRTTWQMAQKHKLAGYFANQPRYAFSFPPTTGASITTPEALVYQDVSGQYAQVIYTSPLSSRLLLEAGLGFNHGAITRHPGEEVKPDRYSILDQGTGVTFNAPTSIGYVLKWLVPTYRVAASYVTGSHAMKGRHRQPVGLPDDRNPRAEQHQPEGVERCAEPDHAQRDARRDRDGLRPAARNVCAGSVDGGEADAHRRDPLRSAEGERAGAELPCGAVPRGAELRRRGERPELEGPLASPRRGVRRLR